jgi:O-glycosyl hydrolase
MLPIALAGASLMALAACAGPAPVGITVDPSVRHQTLIGYGQGSMDQRNPPWYREVTPDGREKLLDLLYTLKGSGLGWNICRTYICAGDAEGHAHFSRRAGGALSPLGYEPQDGVFTWDGHEISLWHCQGAAARGCRMVAFFNSPPAWMTVSGCTSGSVDGKSDNLRAGMEGRFARHICDVLAHYRDAWGIDFEFISPINEPEADWWKAGGGQDGCHVGVEQAKRIVRELRAELDRRGMPTRIQAYESAYTNASWYLNALLSDSQVAACIDTLTCHQYIVNEGALRTWAQRAREAGKELWMSEWGDWTNRGMKLALNYATHLHQAHRVLLTPAWCVWEPGFLIEAKGDEVRPNKAFYAVGQFTRFARPGDVVVEAESAPGALTTAYLREPERLLTLVSVNPTEEAQEVSYDLSAFTSPDHARLWRTSATENLEPLPDAPVGQGLTLRLTLPAQSITTVVVPYGGLRG